MLQTCQQSAYTTISSLRLMELFSEGGILAFVTSRGVTDAPGNKFVRDYLVNHANLIMALRLPDNLFMQTSGIEVGSDPPRIRRIQLELPHTASENH